MLLSPLGCAVISLHDLKSSGSSHWPCSTVSVALGRGIKGWVFGKPVVQQCGMRTPAVLAQSYKTGVPGNDGHGGRGDREKRRPPERAHDIRVPQEVDGVQDVLFEY